MSKMAPKECNNEKSLRNTGLKIWNTHLTPLFITDGPPPSFPQGPNGPALLIMDKEFGGTISWGSKTTVKKLLAYITPQKQYCKG